MCIDGVSQNLRMINGRLETISGHFFLCQLHEDLSQNWGSYGHFDVLNRSKLWLVQRLWHKTQIFPFLVLGNFVQKHAFAYFAFLHFGPLLLYQIRFRIFKHLKMMVWISVLWKINTQLAKKWPDMVVKWPFIRFYFLKKLAKHAQGLHLHQRP